jgi:hypothetical protein
MKKSSKKEATMSIQEVAELFKSFTQSAKAAEAAAKPYKEMLLEYAEEHPKEFDGTTLLFPNGVRVETRVTNKPTWDNDSVDLDWLDRALDTDLEKYISVKIDKITEASEYEVELLDEIGYGVEEIAIFAVYEGGKK